MRECHSCAYCVLTSSWIPTVCCWPFPKYLLCADPFLNTYYECTQSSRNIRIRQGRHMSVKLWWLPQGHFQQVTMGPLKAIPAGAALVVRYHTSFIAFHRPLIQRESNMAYTSDVAETRRPGAQGRDQKFCFGRVQHRNARGDAEKAVVQKGPADIKSYHQHKEVI